MGWTKKGNLKGPKGDAPKGAVTAEAVLDHSLGIGKFVLKTSEGRQVDTVSQSFSGDGVDAETIFSYRGVTTKAERGGKSTMAELNPVSIGVGEAFDSGTKAMLSYDAAKDEAALSFMGKGRIAAEAGSSLRVEAKAVDAETMQCSETMRARQIMLTGPYTAIGSDSGKVDIVGDAAVYAASGLDASMKLGNLATACEARSEGGGKSLIVAAEESVSVESKNGLFVNGGRVFTGPRNLWRGKAYNGHYGGANPVMFDGWSAFVLRVATSDGFVVPIEVRMADDERMNVRTYSGSTTTDFTMPGGYQKRATFSFGVSIEKSNGVIVGNEMMMHVDDAAGRFDDNNIFLVSAEGLW